MGRSRVNENTSKSGGYGHNAWDHGSRCLDIPLGKHGHDPAFEVLLWTDTLERHDSAREVVTSWGLGSCLSQCWQRALSYSVVQITIFEATADNIFAVSILMGSDTKWAFQLLAPIWWSTTRNKHIMRPLKVIRSAGPCIMIFFFERIFVPLLICILLLPSLPLNIIQGFRAGNDNLTCV